MGSTKTLYGFLSLLLTIIGVALFGVWRASRVERAPHAARLRDPLLFLGILTGAMLISGYTAGTGALLRFDAFPPPAMVMLVGITTITIAAVFSRWGSRMARATPWVWLVFFQAFRFPLELILHSAWRDGILPIQLTYSGLNFDIISGLLALLLGLLSLRRGGLPRWSLWAFEAIGFALLVNVVAVAVASLPLFAAFGPDHLNTGVLIVPYVWLPVVFVQFALGAHLLLLRKLIVR